MSVYKREGRGWYVDVTVEYPDGTNERRRKKSTLNTKRDAEAYERDLRTEMLDEWRKKRMGLDGDVPTLADFEEEFFGVVSGKGLKGSTLRSYRQIFEQHLVPAFGPLALDAIGPREIEKFKADRSDLAPKTLRNFLGVLSRLLHTAHALDVIRAVPHIASPRAPKPPFDFWDFDEADRVLAQLHTEPLADPWIRLALSTGLRCGELAGLQWGDVDLAQRQLHVRRQVYRLAVTTPKSNRQRTVPLSDAAVEALEMQKPRTLMQALKGEGWVFWERAEDSAGRTPSGWITDDRVKRAFDRVVVKAGVKRIRLHDMRHTFASHCVMRGVPLEVLQQWLGHADIQMTQRYAHLAPRHTHSFVELLNGAPAAPTRHQEKRKPRTS